MWYKVLNSVLKSSIHYQSFWELQTKLYSFNDNCQINIRWPFQAIPRIVDVALFCFLSHSMTTCGCPIPWDFHETNKTKYVVSCAVAEAPQPQLKSVVSIKQ